MNQQLETQKNNVIRIVPRQLTRYQNRANPSQHVSSVHRMSRTLLHSAMQSPSKKPAERQKERPPGIEPTPCLGTSGTDQSSCVRFDGYNAPATLFNMGKKEKLAPN